MPDQAPKRRWRKIASPYQTGDIPVAEIDAAMERVKAKRASGEYRPGKHVDLRELGRDWIARQHGRAQ